MMGYGQEPYEDELDRMQARRQRKKQAGNTPAPRTPSQGWDDTIIYRKPGDPSYNRDSAGFENFDLDENWDQDTDLNFETMDLEDDGWAPQPQSTRASYRDPHPGIIHAETIRSGNTRSGNTRPRSDYNASARSGNRNSRTRRPDSSGTGAAQSRPPGNHSGKKRRKKGHAVALFLLLAVLIGAGTFLFRWMREDSVWTVAVFGVDSRDGRTGKGALSDVEMLCSINRKTGEIRLLSVFRDSYLRIDQDDEYDKINEAYFLGGAEQGVKALEDNFDLQIDDYATFNWKAVVDAINILGGIDLEITDKEFGYINSFITETVESTGVGSHHLESSGMNHLDGVQAVAYARLRLMDTDFNRTERQRKVLGLTMEKAKNADMSTLTSLVGAVYPQIETSIGASDILSMAKNPKKYYISQTSGFPFSHQEIKIGKKACVVPTTLESNVVQLHSFLYDTDGYTISERVRSISNHIIEVSGLGEPGKDTESGKNIGAEGNSGSGQTSGGSGSAASQPPQTQPSTETEPVTAESESASTEEQESTEPEEETIDALESEDSSESSENTHPGDAENGSSTGDSNNGSGSQTEENQETPRETVTAGGGRPSNDNGPGTERPGNSGNTGNTPEPPRETNASLEAPGQGTGTTDGQEEGPGTT